MKSLSDTILGRTLGRVAKAVTKYRWAFLWPQVLLCGLCILYTARNLKFDPSRDNLVGSGQKYHQIYLQFRQEFRDQDDIVVVVESENSEKNRQFIERLGSKVDKENGHIFTNVLYRNDFKMLGKKALLFASADDLKELRQKLRDYKPFIERFTQTTNLQSLFTMINTQIRTAKDEDNSDNRAMMKAFPMLQTILDQATGSLQRPGTPPSPGITALFGAGDEDIYITLATNRIYLLTAQAPTEDGNDAAVERMRSLVQQTQKEVPGVNVGLTGGPVLDHDEMEQSQRDSTVASIVSLVVCALIFIYGYQETGRPLKATFCLLIGLGYTMAFTTLVVGHLNILTITFMPILIGLAIDFGVHLITRYEEELRLGRTEAVAIHSAMVFTGQGIFTGALTTSVAFLAMGLTHFKGIQEMGIICGGGMLVCLVPMLTMLPVMLFRGRQNTIDIAHASKPDIRVRIESIWLRRPVWVAVITVMLCGLAYSQFKKIYFDYDLLNMQANGLPAVVFEKKLITSSTSKSVLFAAVEADSPEQAVELEAKLRKLTNTVADIESMAPRVLGAQTEKLKLIHQIREDIASIHFAPADQSPLQITPFGNTLYYTYGYLGNIIDRLLIDGQTSLMSGDITNLESFVKKLRKPAVDDGLSPYLVSKLSSNTVTLLAKYTNGADDKLDSALTDDLNRIAQDGTFYDAQRFNNVSLSKEAKTLLGVNDNNPGVEPGTTAIKLANSVAPQPLQGTNLLRLNRLLMHDAYPQEISRTPRIAAQMSALRDNSIIKLKKEMLSGNAEVVSQKLATFQQALFNDIHDTFQALQDQDDTSPLRAKDLPLPLQSRFIGKHNKYLLQVYPKEDVWQRDKQERFVKELQTVAPNVTGTPVQLYYYTELLKDSYIQAAWYSLGAIVVMIFLHFRTLSSVILALLPVAIGSIWFGGLMGWFNIHFNPANIMTLPLVIGIGVTNGIHILNRYEEERNPWILSKSTGKAVFVSGLTAISGFGSLILGRHQGIRSLGEVMAMGLATCMIAALTFLPTLLKLLDRNKTTPTKQPSGDNARSTLGREEPR